MKGIKGYSKPSERGVVVDVEGMLVDLITIYKAGGFTEATLLAEVKAKWPQVKVEVRVPDASKN